MEKMLNAYDEPSSSSPFQEDMATADSKAATEPKKKKPQAKAPAPVKATGKRTRASQRRQGPSLSLPSTGFQKTMSVSLF